MYGKKVYKDITAIIISSNVKAIEESTFADCISSSTIEIPSSVKNIQRYAFFGCLSLQLLTISDDYWRMHFRISKIALPSPA